MSSYSEKLKDPRWLDRRATILAKAKGKCAACGASDGPLQVHHVYYAPYREPWAYEDRELKALCPVCHEKVTCAMVALGMALSGLPVDLLIKANCHQDECLSRHFVESLSRTLGQIRMPCGGCLHA